MMQHSMASLEFDRLRLCLIDILEVETIGRDMLSHARHMPSRKHPHAAAVDGGIVQRYPARDKGSRLMLSTVSLEVGVVLVRHAL